LAHATIKTDISPEWVRALDDLDDSNISVGGLAHRLGMLRPRSTPNRVTLAKFFEFARRDRNQSRQELADSAGVDLGDVFALERVDGPSPDADVITLVAKALEVEPEPLLKLAGHSQNKDQQLNDVAVQFAARLETKPLEPQEREALSWLRSHAFKVTPAPARVGADQAGT
jgi:transcriptional regulator with XRE-family HTH domain